MIYKRAVARLRAQDWLAITIELIIVVVGVFIGTMVANWNLDRLERAETRKMVGQLSATLQTMNTYWPSARTYYGTTLAYGEKAIAGWSGDRSIDDREFVVAAYQASQINVISVNGSALSQILGANRLDQIEDKQLRADLSALIQNDWSLVDQETVDTPYRRNVRRIIPIDVQDAIREQCGDQAQDQLGSFRLPATCPLDYPQERITVAAKALRAHPELMEDLQWHMASTRSFLGNIEWPSQATARVAASSRKLVL